MTIGVVPYILAGYPDMDTTFELLDYCHQIGIRMIELGIPFTDPSADGPVIQDMSSRTAVNFKWDVLIKRLQEIKTDAFSPEITLMTYFNPAYQYGLSRLGETLKHSPVKGLLVPDLPVEEVGFVKSHLNKGCSLKQVWLASSNLTEDHLKKISSMARYYVYLVAYLGTTGKHIQNHRILKQAVNTLKQQRNVPVVVGFGIKSRQDVEQVLTYANGAVIGTELIRQLDKGLPRAKAFLSHLI